jgi:hypothetical protein
MTSIEWIFFLSVGLNIVLALRVLYHQCTRGLERELEFLREQRQNYTASIKGYAGAARAANEAKNAALSRLRCLTIQVQQAFQDLNAEVKVGRLRGDIDSVLALSKLVTEELGRPENEWPQRAPEDLK